MSYFTTLSVGLLISIVLLVAVSECTKYTSKELEELRKFYYDTEPSEEDTPKEKHVTKEPRKQAEPRSSKPARKKKPSAEEEDEDKVIGPGELLKDAKKYLEAGKKTIDKEAQRILPRILFRGLRSVDKDYENDSEYDADSENDEPSTSSTTTTQKPKSSRRPFKDRKRSTTTERSSFLKPFEKISDDWLNAAQDAGGTALKFFNKLRTPIPGLPLPTLPVPNLEDFGG